MGIITFTKLISDIALYFAVTGFIMRFNYYQGSAMISGGVFIEFILLILSGTGAYLLRNKRAFRFVPLLLLIPLFIISRDSADKLWMALPSLYIIVNAVKNRYGCDRKKYMRTWKIYMSVAAIATFTYLIIPYTDGGARENGAPLFFIVYAAASVMLMRALRQPDDVLDSPGYAVKNIMTLLTVAAFSFSLSYAARILNINTESIGYWLYTVGQALDSGFTKMKFDWGQVSCARSFSPIDYTAHPSDSPLNHHTASFISGMPVGVMIFLIAAVAALFVLAAVILFKRRDSRHTVASEKIRDADEGEKPRVTARSAVQETLSNRKTVRKLYRKFLNACRKKQIAVNAYDTTLDIMNSAQDAFDSNALQDIRAVYAMSRYDGQTPVQDEDVRTAKTAYLAIKRGTK